MSKSKLGRSKTRPFIPIPLSTLIMPEEIHVNIIVKKLKKI